MHLNVYISPNSDMILMLLSLGYYIFVGQASLLCPQHNFFIVIKDILYHFLQK